MKNKGKRESKKETFQGISILKATGSSLLLVIMVIIARIVHVSTILLKTSDLWLFKILLFSEFYSLSLSQDENKPSTFVGFQIDPLLLYIYIYVDTH